MTGRKLKVANDAPPCTGSSRCTNAASDLHPCPYQEDVNGNPEDHCTCCADCQYECAMDI